MHREGRGGARLMEHPVARLLLLDQPKVQHATLEPVQGPGMGIVSRVHTLMSRPQPHNHNHRVQTVISPRGYALYPSVQLSSCLERGNTHGFLLPPYPGFLWFPAWSQNIQRSAVWDGFETAQHVAPVLRAHEGALLDEAVLHVLIQQLHDLHAHALQNSNAMRRAALVAEHCISPRI